MFGLKLARGDLHAELIRHPNAPPVQHSYRLVVRRESSLPRGQRPWDRT